MIKKPDYRFKVNFVGKKRCGKTMMLNRYSLGYYAEAFTGYPDMFFRNPQCNGEEIMLILFDNSRNYSDNREL